MSRTGRYLRYEVAVLARIARAGRHLLCEVAALARIAGRCEPCFFRRIANCRDGSRPSTSTIQP